jgi:predicted dienelactone hydrolase
VRSRLALLTVACLFAVGACGGSDDSSTATDAPDPTDAPPETQAPTTEPPLEPLEILPPGPYGVGVTTVIINPGTDRPLTTDVWFPLDGPAGDLARHEYTLIPGLTDTSDTAVDAEYVAMSPDGPFPLVVYSHGSGGLRYAASDYTEAIASYGYIVVSADHTGNTALDGLLCTRTDGMTTMLNRVNDVQAIINELTDPDSLELSGFVDSVDPERIAVTGHSFGGFTTYAAVTGFENELGAVAADRRVDAIIPLAPAIGGDRPPSDEADTEDAADEESDYVDPCATPEDETVVTEPPTEEEATEARNQQLITDEQLASITVPAMVIVGTDDATTPVDPNVTRAWELSNSDPHYRVELVAGQHQSFTNACRYAELLPTWPEDLQALAGPLIEYQASEGCGEGIMDIERAQDLTNTFAITFLDATFRGGEMISDDTTEIPDDVVVMAK